MIRIVTVLVFSLTLVTGCAFGPSRSEVMAKLNARFDAAKDQIEQRAHSGQITWVQAAIQVRDLDKKFASIPELQEGQYWKFNSDDQEYHAFCVALAEKLDNKQITFAQFDAARTQRFNQIRAIRETLDSQQEAAANAGPRSQSCTTKNVGTRDFPEYRTFCH